MSWWNNFFGGNQPLQVERDRGGNWFYRLFSSDTSFKNVTTDAQKLHIILSNPAVLKVFKLNCDLFSLGKIKEYKDNKLVDDNALKNIQEKPNKHQTWKQFLWDYMFYSMLGTAYLWRSGDSKIFDNNYFFLNPSRIKFPNDLVRKLDKLTISQETFNNLQNENIDYVFSDGTTQKIQLKEVTPFFDLSNSVSDNWYKGNSVIDAIYKVISNIEEGLDSKNINTRYSAKFLISGEQDSENIYQTPMTEIEKESMEQKMNGNKTVYAVKSMIDIKRFVSDLGKLKLDESYLNDYFIIGSMFNIPRNVLEAELTGSTYENQEKSTGKHISYSLQPKGDDLFEWFSTKTKKDLKIDFTHLPFMQVFEKDKSEVNFNNAKTIDKLILNGFTKEEALTFLKIKL